MKKFLLMIGLIFYLAACGNSSSNAIPTVSVNPTAIEVMTSNRLVSINEENFSSEVSNLVKEVTKYNSEIGSFLANCDVGITREDGVELFENKENPNCLIIFVPNSLTHMENLKDFAPSDSSGGITVAITKDIIGSDYPFIFLGEREFDLFYLSRVLAHEGFHAKNIKYQMDCVETPMCEETNAYKVQFDILKRQYPDYSGLDSVLLPGTGVIGWRALDMEQYLFELYEKGTLQEELISMGYGNGE